MKFTISSNDLTRILAQMMKVIPSKPLQPILSCLLVKVKSGILEMTATDMENTSTFITPCTDGEDGEMAVDAKFLHTLLRTLPEMPVIFESDNASVNISWGTGTAEVPTQDAADFPAVRECDGDKVIISASELKNALAIAAPRADQNGELHPTLNGVCLDFDSRMLNIVATDTHQLVITGIAVPGNASKATYILPLTAVAALRNLTDNTDGDVMAICDGRNIKFSTIEQTLTCRLVEGRYPSYASIMPPDSSTEVTVGRDTLAGALKRISICAENKKPRVVLTISGKGIKVQAKDLSNGLNGKETVAITDLKGDDIEISFNAEILTSLLSGFPDKEVVLRFNGPSRAALLYPTSQDINTRALVMPTV